MIEKEKIEKLVDVLNRRFPSESYICAESPETYWIVRVDTKRLIEPEVGALSALLGMAQADLSETMHNLCDTDDHITDDLYLICDILFLCRQFRSETNES